MTPQQPKKEVLQSSRKLKGKEEYKEVYVKLDLTQEQRKAMSELLAGAKRREADDKSGKLIYRVRGPPEKLVIKRIRKQM